MQHGKWGIKIEAIIVIEDSQANRWPRSVTSTKCVNAAIVSDGTCFRLMPPGPPHLRVPNSRSLRPQRPTERPYCRESFRMRGAALQGKERTATITTRAEPAPVFSH